MKARICILSAAGALIALAASSSSAFAASGFTLQLVPPPSAVVGQPTVMKANGTIPTRDLEFSYWFSLDAISASVTTTCPADAFEGAQLANGTGGAVIVLTQREPADSSGNFTIPVGITPSKAGKVLLCGYTDDGAATTLAMDSLILTIRSAGSSGGSRRASPATEVKQAVRSCRALLSKADAKPCIRRAVAHGKRRCRKLHSHSKRRKCVRSVRRAARA